MEPPSNILYDSAIAFGGFGPRIRKVAIQALPNQRSGVQELDLTDIAQLHIASNLS
jgi:hypothetical protein